MKLSAKTTLQREPSIKTNMESKNSTQISTSTPLIEELSSLEKFVSIS